jgi:hypothetical protein
MLGPLVSGWPSFLTIAPFPAWLPVAYFHTPTWRLEPILAA